MKGKFPPAADFCSPGILAKITLSALAVATFNLTGSCTNSQKLFKFPSEIPGEQKLKVGRHSKNFSFAMTSRKGKLFFYDVIHWEIYLA